jgi:hypothetical protein
LLSEESTNPKKIPSNQNVSSKLTNSPGDTLNDEAKREILEALGKKKDSIEQLRHEKYKPLQNPIEEEKTEENLTVENDDNYGVISP